MMTLLINGTLGANVADPRDGMYKPSKKKRTAWLAQADGFHVFYDMGDGKTVNHVFKPIADILATIQAANPDLNLPPKPVVKSISNDINKTS
jgi:hypothetical protein